MARSYLKDEEQPGWADPFTSQIPPDNYVDTGESVSDLPDDEEDTQNPSLKISATSPRDKVRQYISSKYDQAADTDSVERASKVNMLMPGMAGIGAGLDRIVSAPSVALGGPGANDQFWQGLRQDSQSDLENEEQGRQAGIADYLNKKNLGNQEINQQQQEQKFDKSNELDDPKSQVSRAYQAGVAKLYPEIVSQFDIASLSANDIHRIFTDYNAKNTSELNAKYKDAQMKALTTKQKNNPKYIPGLQGPAGYPVQQNSKGGFEEIPGFKTIPKNLSKKSVGEAAGFTDPDDLTEDDTHNMLGRPIILKNANKARDDVYDKMITARGAKAYQQAKVNIMAAKSALEIMDEYPDYNKMPDPQVTQLNIELTKMASGGVPTEDELHSLNPKTATSTMQAAKQYISGIPEGAQKGEFIKNSRKYILGLQKVAKEEVANTAGKILEGRAPSMSKRDFDYFMENNPEIKEVWDNKKGRSVSTPVEEEASTKNDAPPKPDHKTPRAVPGTIVNIKGHGRFKIDQDGESLIPIQ